MKACPFCRSRATKLVSLTTGLISCQQCGRSYEIEGVKEAVASAVADTNAEFEHRFIHGSGSLTPRGLIPNYCAAATPEECDHPHGCTACTQPSATCDWRGACSISNRCLFVGCFYPLGDMCVFCFTLRPPPALGRSFVDVMLSPEGLRSLKELEVASTVILPPELQADNAVARPVSSQQGPSIRVDKRDKKRGHALDRTRE